MRTVYKYKIPIKDTFNIDLPMGYDVLSVGVQEDQAVIWVLVDMRAFNVSVGFRLLGTGHSGMMSLRSLSGRLVQ